MTATLRTRANFAGQHLLAAGRFARMTGEVETKNAGGSSADAFYAEIAAYVPAALLTASAALEAYINEVFIDGKVFPLSSTEGISEDLWDIWWNEIDRKSALEKYDLALKLRRKDRFSKDRQSPHYPKYLSADLLIRVRNALMHFKPQWSDEEKSHQQIAKDLLKEQVSASPFGSNSPLFPTDFMSHDMARWAVKTAWQFIEVFSALSDVPNKYAYMVDDINPGYPNSTNGI